MTQQTKKNKQSVAKDVEMDIKDPEINDQSTTQQNERSYGAYCGFSNLAIILIIASVVALVMICAMVPSSYYGVEYDEYAISRNKLTNKVDYSRVYTNGHYYLGLNYEMITFPRTYVYEEFKGNALRVFSSEGLEFPFQFSFQWRPMKKSIPSIHRKFRTSYRPQVINRVIATIKNTVTRYSTDDFINRRAEIDSVITQAIGDAVDDLGFEIPADKFQLAKPILPDNVRHRFLQTQIQLVKNEEQALHQQEAAVLQETGVLVNQILSNATKTVTEAHSTAARILSEAQSIAFASIQSANQAGLARLINDLNITETATLLKIITLEDSPDVKLYFGAGPVSQVLPI